MEQEYIANVISLSVLFTIGYLLLMQRWKPVAMIFVLLMIVQIMKNLIQQPRPAGAMNCNMISQGGVVPYDSYGMPSAHVAVFVAALIMARVHPVFVGLGAVAMSWSRIVLGCHTLPQTIAGTVVGTMFGLFVRNFLL